MDSSSETTTEMATAPVDYENLEVVDEINDTPTEETAADSDDEVQFIGEYHTTTSTNNRKRNLDNSGTVEIHLNGLATTSVSTATKRQKIGEVNISTTVREIEISEPQSDHSPDIADNEADFVCNIRSETREFVVSKKKHGKQKQAPVLNEKIWALIRVYREKYPKKFQHFDNQIMTHYIRNIQNDVIYGWKMVIRRKILDVIREFYAYADLYVVGSTINGCGSYNADMDLCCAIPRTEYSSNERTFAIKALRKIRTLLYKKKFFLEMENCTLISAKVPILRINFGGNYQNLEVDLNVNNLAGVYNSYLLHYYSRIDDRFPALCLLVKHWAKRNEIGEAMNGTLNSYSIILLVIHFLQVAVSPPILPNLQKCFPEMFNDTRPLGDCILFQDLEKRYSDPALNKRTVGELLIAFFEYYSTFDFHNWAISICDARIFPRTELADSTARFKIFIEEPFEKINTARCVTSDINFEMIKNTFINARNWFLSKRRPDIKHIGVQECFNLAQ